MERRGQILDLFWKQIRSDTHKTWLSEAVGERSREHGQLQGSGFSTGRTVGPFRGEEVGEIGKLSKYCERCRFRPENL